MRDSVPSSERPEPTMKTFVPGAGPTLSWESKEVHLVVTVPVCTVSHHDDSFSHMLSLIAVYFSDSFGGAVVLAAPRWQHQSSVVDSFVPLHFLFFSTAFRCVRKTNLSTTGASVHVTRIFSPSLPPCAH